MKKEHAHKFNDEIEHYRKSLLYYARACDWKTFEKKAGVFFDYVESIEQSEVKRKFIKIFCGILFSLIVFFISFHVINLEAYPELTNIKGSVPLLMLIGICYELNFFLNFRIYREKKMIYYKKRKDYFVKSIERDFKEISVHPQS